MEKFNKLTIIEEKKKGWVNCKCECGNDYFGQYIQIKSGKVKSCGCYKKKKEVQIGMSETKFYSVYRNILARCNNPKNIGFSNYGGRGIKCEWKNFEEFYNDMFPSYAKGLSIERINNDGNYCKENCSWVTKKEQNGNKQDSIRYEGKCLMQNMIDRGLDQKQIKSVYKRIERGWTIERALTDWTYLKKS